MSNQPSAMFTAPFILVGLLAAGALGGLVWSYFGTVWFIIYLFVGAPILGWWAVMAAIVIWGSRHEPVHNAGGSLFAAPFTPVSGDPFMTPELVEGYRPWCHTYGRAMLFPPSSTFTVRMPTPARGQIGHLQK